MAFDEKLAARIRAYLGKRAGLTEKKMFGGIAILIKRKMCCCIHRDALIVRLDPAATERALVEPHSTQQLARSPHGLIVTYAIPLVAFCRLERTFTVCCVTPLTEAGGKYCTV